MVDKTSQSVGYFTARGSERGETHPWVLLYSVINYLGSAWSAWVTQEYLGSSKTTCEFVADRFSWSPTLWGQLATSAWVMLFSKLTRKWRHVLARRLYDITPMRYLSKNGPNLGVRHAGLECWALALRNIHRQAILMNSTAMIMGKDYPWIPNQCTPFR